MSVETSHHHVEMGSERGFGFVFAAVFALIGLAPLLFGSGSARWWALLAAAAFLACSLFAPHWLAPLNRLWFRFGLLLGRFVAPVVMGLVFFVVVTPIALLARAFGKDFLRTGEKAKHRGSHWVARTSDPAHPSSMNNQF